MHALASPDTSTPNSALKRFQRGRRRCKGNEIQLDWDLYSRCHRSSCVRMSAVTQPIHVALLFR